MSAIEHTSPGYGEYNDSYNRGYDYYGDRRRSYDNGYSNADGWGYGYGGDYSYSQTAKPGKDDVQHFMVMML